MLKCSELKQIIKNNGGFSINANGDSPKNGYMVSVKDMFQLKLSDITDNEIEKLEIELNNLEKQGYKNGYIGGWLDSETDIVYLDISYNFRSLGLALSEASNTNQLAIYDIANDTSIYLKDFTSKNLKDVL